MIIQDPEHIFDAEEFARSIEKSAMGAFMNDKLNDLIDREIDRDMERTLSGKGDIDEELLCSDNDNDSEADRLFFGKRIPNELFIQSLGEGYNYEPEFLLQKAFQDMADGNFTAAWNEIAEVYGTETADRFIKTGKI
ncbi:UbiA family prenyltransferase [Treponema sp.]|uniref:UbiA family prenyltransferase n=1 Tax=Treponema sp. TaxID=166 RepID=UPI00388FDDCF